MLRWSGFAVLLLTGLVAWAGWIPAATEKADPGKDIFLKYKCNSCHGMQAQGIAVKKSDEKEEPEEAGEEAEEKDPPDLSGVGLKHKADWMTKYLKKQEAIDGDKHRKKFRGKADEMKALTVWLEAQKTKVEASAKKGGEAK